MPSGRPPKPPGQSTTRHKPTHPWQHATDVGWQHGDIPEAPDGMVAQSRRAWELWFASWWASNWAEADLPQLEVAVLAYDGVVRGDVDVSKLHPLLDKLGITPKGRQDLRWAPPKGDDATARAESEAVTDEMAKRREERKKRIS